MTATITAPSPADTARAVLERAASLTWPDEAKAALDVAATGLRDALWRYGALRTGRADWEAVDPDIAQYAELARHGIALDKTTEHVEEWAGHLAEVIGKHIGQGADEYIANGGTT
jgi:hypothetical protein